MSWYRDYLPEGQLVVDASFLINALGCGAAPEIFSGLTSPCLVEDRVFDEISRHPVPGLCHIKELESLEESGFIRRTTMTDTEYAEFLGIVQAPLGVRLDAGESATLVVASARGLSVVIDENKGRSFARKRMPHVPTVSTLKVFISAACRRGQEASFLKRIVEQAMLHARMGVPKDEKHLLSQVLQVK